MISISHIALLLVVVGLCSHRIDASFDRTSVVAGNAYSALMGVATGDVNGDEVNDIVGVTHGSNHLITYFGTGGGSFENAVYRGTMTGSHGYQVHLVDWDGDGDLDAVTVNWQGAYLQVFINSNAGLTWTRSTIFTSHQRDVNFVDLFDNGNIYAIVGGSSTASYRTNGGDVVNAGSGSFNSVTALDVDGDGIKDIVTCNGGAVGYFKGTGTGFSSTYTSIVSTSCLFVKAQDMNGDCHDDLVIGGTTSRVYFYEPGTSTHTRTTSLSTPGVVNIYGGSLVFGDMSKLYIYFVLFFKSSCLVLANPFSLFITFFFSSELSSPVSASPFPSHPPLSLPLPLYFPLPLLLSLSLSLSPQKKKTLMENLISLWLEEIVRLVSIVKAVVVLNQHMRAHPLVFLGSIKFP